MTHTKAHANEKSRNLIVWETAAIGSGAFIEMYVNPTNLKITEKKIQDVQRTKGGYILQYWGEDLTKISLTGEVGAGGIEAINVIRDVYRGEQLALQTILSSRGTAIKRRQSLAQLATSTIMWYMGQGFRGFFTDFNYNEKPSGVFDYSLEFSAVEVIGQRKNFMPWQRKPWSTLDSPSFDTGQGILQGGAYGTNTKMGELNAPAVNPVNGVLDDPEFRTTTGATPSQEKLQENLQENAAKLGPSDLFA